MLQAILERERGVQFAIGPIHGLQEEMPEGQMLKLFRFRAGLRVNQLQLIAAALLEPCAGLWTDANPIETCRSRDGSTRIVTRAIPGRCGFNP